MNYIPEIVFALLITYIFIRVEKPKIKYLLFGYLTFFAVLLIQLPFKIVESIFKDFFVTNILPSIAIVFFTISVTEIAKFLALKKFVKTKSIKNAVLFAIGWTTIESINIFSLLFFNLIFSILPIDLNIKFLQTTQIAFISFIIIFIINLAISILVIFAIVKKSFSYLIFAIFLAFSVSIALMYFGELEKLFFIIIIFIYSLYIIFRYKNLGQLFI